MAGRLCMSLCTAAVVLSCLSGCGTTKSSNATEQLLLSAAVDRSVAAVNFRALSGRKVFLDAEYVVRNTAFLPGQTTANYVNSEYLLGSLRQQMAAAGCLLQDKREDADFVVEVRVGTLGADVHEVIYGVPENNLLGAAANFVPAAPTAPSIPEIAVAKRNQQLAAAKVVVFAYDRVSREIVWQSGVSEARSTAKATWLLGVGPFQQGEIHSRTDFAGESWPLSRDGRAAAPPVDYFRETHYVRVPDARDADEAFPVDPDELLSD